MFKQYFLHNQKIRTLSNCLHSSKKEIQENDKTQLIDVLHLFGIEFPFGEKCTYGKYSVRLLEDQFDNNLQHLQKLDKLGLDDK